jgi:beta-ureidopropionase / N-carbamoyl-L-amino-acid hydrolase
MRQPGGGMKPVQQTSPALALDAAQLQRRLDEIVRAGSTRIAYSAEDARSRSVVLAMMRELGLQTRIDEAGNLIGRYPGRSQRPALAFGSHVDTVRHGGRYDGALGVAAALQCVAAIVAAGYEPAHPLEVIVFANEEGQNFGALCGSRAMIGELHAYDLARIDDAGRTLAEAIDVIGGQSGIIGNAIRQPGEIAAFLELHIEQGAVLESMSTPIGVVEGISAISYTDVRVIGTANHSGTTVMEMRCDALVAAARFTLGVQSVAVEGRCRVATVGRLNVHPNAANIIPGEVALTVELRDLERERIAATLKHLRAHAGEIAADSGVRFEFAERDLIEAVPCSPGVQAAIIASCNEMGVPYHRMPSGAGHDAQMMGKIAPMGMIFVPSSGGVSHSPAEFTSAEHCALGAEILLRTLLRLDRPEADPATGAE